MSEGIDKFIHFNSSSESQKKKTRCQTADVGRES